MNILQEMMKPLPVGPEGQVIGLSSPTSDSQPSSESGVSSQGGTPSTPNSSTSSQQDATYYKVRSQLMANIIRKMLNDLHPPPSPSPAKTGKIVATSGSHALTSKTPLWELLDASFSAALTKNSLDMKNIHQLDSLLSVGGPTWFVDALFRQIISKRGLTPENEHEYVGAVQTSFTSYQELNRCADLILGLFHLDIEDCTLSMLVNVLPRILISAGSEISNECFDFNEPRSMLVARLSVMAIYSAFSESRRRMAASMSNQSSNPYAGLSPAVARRRKRRYNSITSDPDNEFSVRAAKLLKTGQEHDTSTQQLETPFAYRMQQLQQQSQRSESQSSENGQGDHSMDVDQKPDMFKETLKSTKDPLNASVADLLKLLATIVSQPDVNQRSQFALLFLQQVLLCAKQDADQVLQFLPVNLLPTLIKVFPESISFEM